MHEFRYHRAHSVANAAEAFAGHPDAMFIAGGQSLLPMLRSRLAAPGLVVDLRNVAALHGIEATAGALRIGAGTCHVDVADHAVVRGHIPALAELAGAIGDMHVRNLGTLGGSLALNDPAADYAASVLALDATIETDRRLLPASRFLDGMMTTALEPGEIVVGVVFRIPQAAAYGRIRNPVSGFPMAGVMVARFPEGHRVGVTGVGSDGAFRWPEVERRLDRGEGIEAAGAALPAGTEVLVDQQAGRDFRCHLLRLAAGRAIARLD